MPRRLVHRVPPFVCLSMQPKITGGKRTLSESLFGKPSYRPFCCSKANCAGDQRKADL